MGSTVSAFARLDRCSARDGALSEACNPLRTVGLGGKRTRRADETGSVHAREGVSVLVSAVPTGQLGWLEGRMA